MNEQDVKSADAGRSGGADRWAGRMEETFLLSFPAILKFWCTHASASRRYKAIIV